MRSIAMLIGELLAESGIISHYQKELVLRQQSQMKQFKLGQILKGLKFLTDSQLSLALEAQASIKTKETSTELALVALRYAELNNVNFEQSVKLVLLDKNISQKNENVICHLLINSSQIKTEVEVDSKLFKEFNSIESLKLIEEQLSAGNLSLAQEIFDGLCNKISLEKLISKEKEIIIRCRFLFLYHNQNDIGQEVEKHLESILSIIDKSSYLEKISKDSIFLLVEIASYFHKQKKLFIQANQILKVTLSRWLDLLPFEVEKFCQYLLNAIYTSSNCLLYSKQETKLGQLLVGANLIEQSELNDFLRESKKLSQPLGLTMLEGKKLTFEILRIVIIVQQFCKYGLIPLDYSSLLIKTILFTSSNKCKGTCFGFLEQLFSCIDSSLQMQNKQLSKLIMLLDKLLLVESQQGYYKPEVANLYTQIAEINFLSAELLEAEFMYRRALALCEKLLSTDLEKLANLSFKLGIILLKLEKYRDAESYLMNALQLKTRLRGDNHTELVEILVALGNLYALEHNYSVAINFLRSAWNIVVSVGSSMDKLQVLECVLNCMDKSGQGSHFVTEYFCQQLGWIKKDSVA